MCCNFCLKVLCFEHMYCPCTEATERRRIVAAVPERFGSACSSVHPGPSHLVVPALASGSLFAVPALASGPVADAVPAVAVPAPAMSLVAPGWVSSHLSPGPTYDGPTPDPALMLSPLSSCPDWPISDSWRDYAFETVSLPAFLSDLT